jgi:hypothetical protein
VTTRAGTPATYHPWTTYIYAREEARVRGDRRVGTEHLVLGLLRDPVIASLLAFDLDTARKALDRLDRDALRTIGIRQRFAAAAPPAFGPPPTPTLRAVLQGRLPLTPVAKLALQEAGKPMRRRQQITAPEVLTRLLVREPPDPGAVLFAALGVDRAALLARLPRPPQAA